MPQLFISTHIITESTTLHKHWIVMHALTFDKRWTNFATPHGKEMIAKECELPIEFEFAHHQSITALQWHSFIKLGSMWKPWKEEDDGWVTKNSSLGSSSRSGFTMLSISCFFKTKWRLKLRNIMATPKLIIILRNHGTYLLFFCFHTTPSHLLIINGSCNPKFVVTILCWRNKYIPPKLRLIALSGLLKVLQLQRSRAFFWVPKHYRLRWMMCNTH